MNEIRNALLEEYKVEPDRCERDLLALLKELAAEGLIEVKRVWRALVGRWFARVCSRSRVTAVPFELQATVLKMQLEHTSLEQIRLKASGWSMWPSIRHGDTVIAVHAQLASLKNGDIVIFPGPSGGLVIHRIVRRGIVCGGLQMVQTQGDNSSCPDSPIPVDKVLCRVSAVIPRRSWWKARGGNEKR